MACERQPSSRRYRAHGVHAPARRSKTMKRLLMTAAITTLTAAPLFAQESSTLESRGYVSGFDTTLGASAINQNASTFGVGYRF